MYAGTHLRTRLPGRWLRCLSRICILILLMGALETAQTRTLPLPKQMLILESASGGPYAEFTRQFMRTLRARTDLPANRLNVLAPENASQQLSALDKGDLVVAVGTRATATALQSNTQATVLSVLIPRLTAARLVQETTARQHNISTIYLDQPPSRLLKLARMIMPQSGKLGVILGSATALDKDQLNRAATQHRVTLIYAALEPGKTNPLGALQGIIRDCDALLALPDPTVYNRYSLPPLLLTTFRYRVPVIGFSPAFVNAGAVAGVYSTPTQIGQQAAEMVLNSDLGPGGRYPNHFQVGFNYTVAQALDISLPPIDDAEKSLEDTSGAP